MEIKEANAKIYQDTSLDLHFLNQEDKLYLSDFNN